MPNIGEGKRLKYFAFVIIGIALYSVVSGLSGSRYILYWNIDFNLRYNEIRSVLNGIDPFLVWKGILPSNNCVPFDFSLLSKWPNVNFIHVYPPWSYVPLLPFGFMTYDTAANIYRAIQILILSCFLIGAFRMVYVRSRQGWVAALMLLLMVASARDGVYNCIVVGNFGIIVAFSIFVALSLNEKGHHWLAGIFWALAMIKPQLAALFWLILLLDCNWRSLLTASSIVLVESMIVACICDRSVFTMILSIKDYSVGMFHLAGLLPHFAWPFFINVGGEQFLILVNEFVGILLCIICWWVVRKSPNVWIRHMPAMILCIGWSAFRLHDFSMQLLPVFVAMMAFSLPRTARQLLSCILLCISLICRMQIHYFSCLHAYMNCFVFMACIWFLLENKNEDFDCNSML